MTENKSKKQYLECGKAVSTHGIKGNLRVESWCDSPSVLASIKTLYTKKSDSYTPHKVLKASVQKNMVLVNLEDVDTLEKAIVMKGTVFFAHRDELSKLLDNGGMFIADLLGLPVIDSETGFIYGTLSDVNNIGVHDIYVIKRPDEWGEIQPEAMIPAVKEFVVKIDTDSGIYIKPIEGFFEPLTLPSEKSEDKNS